MTDIQQVFQVGRECFSRLAAATSMKVDLRGISARASRILLELLCHVVLLDLSALFAVWLGTFLLVIFAIPDALPILLTGEDGALLMGQDGALLAREFTNAPRWAYFKFAGPAMFLITVGMAWQAWRTATQQARHQGRIGVKAHDPTS